MEFKIKFLVICIKIYYGLKSRIKLFYNKFFSKAFTYAYLKYHGVETQYGYVTLVGLPIINRHTNSRILIGNGVTLVSTSKGNLAGVNHPVILATLKENAIIELAGENGISGSSIVAKSRILIGKGTGLGINSSIYDTDFHPVSPLLREQDWSIGDKTAEVIIGENVWLAANSIVLKGVKIGKGSVVGANSLVNKSIPENCLYAGNPASFVKKIE